MKYTDIIERALELGITEIELYIQENSGASFRVFDGKLDTFNQKNYFGMALRGLYLGKMGYAYTESLDDIDFVLQQLIQNSKLLTSSEKEIIFSGNVEYPHVDEQLADYEKYANQDKISLLKELEQKILASDSRIKKVSYSMYQENKTNTKIINSHGLNLERNFSYSIVFGGGVAEENGETAVGYGRTAGYRFKELNIDQVVKDVQTDATGTLGAGSIETGQYPVILKRSVASDILESFLSVFSGESAQKKLTLLQNRLGEKVFGDNITIYDDPFNDQAIAKVPFDDEGVPCSTKTIVENGVFKTFLHNLATADYFKTTSTGNGFKPSIASSVRVMPTNFYLKPGTYTKEELISSVEKGIYVTEVDGLHAGINPIAGSFNVQAKGYYIENGRIVRPITLFVVSGNFFEMLNDVDMIANDIEDPFFTVASPTLKIKKLNISGK